MSRCSLNNGFKWLLIIDFGFSITEFFWELYSRTELKAWVLKETKLSLGDEPRSGPGKLFRSALCFADNQQRRWRRMFWLSHGSGARSWTGFKEEEGGRCVRIQVKVEHRSGAQRKCKPCPTSAMLLKNTIFKKILTAVFSSATRISIRDRFYSISLGKAWW